MKYATRLNSWMGAGDDIAATLARIAATGVIRYIDLNYPEHFAQVSPDDIAVILRDTGLTPSSVAMRYRRPFVQGEFTNKNRDVSRRAIALAKEGLDAARTIGCRQEIVWLGFDGYDYTFQKDYVKSIDQIVEAFQELTDYAPDCRISIEYKPYEERVHSLIPSLGMTLHLLDRVDRPNMGATLDFCHMLMAGDMPGFGAAQLLSKGKLFGVHLNDGNDRVDDGLMIASIHPWETLEFLYYLLRYDYDGVIYFDTFPEQEDPADEAMANAATVDLLVGLLRDYGLTRITELIDEADAIKAQLFRNQLLKEIR